MTMSRHSTIVCVFFLLLFVSLKIEASSEFCRPEPVKCNENGPEIRFPFRLNTQHASCGLPGYELSCSNNNNTVLHLPNGGQFHVKDISYLDRIITITDAHQTTCPLQTLISLSLTTSKFPFSEHSRYYSQIWSMAILNCTENITGSGTTSKVVGPIECISDNNHLVFVTDPYLYLDELPPNSNCRVSQMTDIFLPPYEPFDFNRSVTPFLQTGKMMVRWEDAVGGCYHCEKSGHFCAFNFTSHSTLCIKNKGNVN